MGANNKSKSDNRKQLSLKEVYCSEEKVLPLNEISKDISKQYYKDIRTRNPGLHKKLKKLARALLNFHRKNITASELVEPFIHYLNVNRETNPLYTADTIGVKMYLDMLAGNTDEARQTKSMYNNIFNAYLKKKYGDKIKNKSSTSTSANKALFNKEKQ